MMALTERLSGWGRYRGAECEVHRPADAAALARNLSTLPDAIARGNGRSYGDASFNPAATVATRHLDRLVNFDAKTGALTCEAGLLLGDLIDIMLPRGWWPRVTPGTKLVTIGGMVACDVHGKNHHGAGSFCDHVDWIDLATGEGEPLRCSRTEHPDLFAATCGGMGLTGVVLRVRFRMMRVETAAVSQRTVRAPTLAHAIDQFEQSLDSTYSVAWVDCLASGDRLGRSAILLGEHARVDELPASRRATPLGRAPRRAKRVPIDLPPFVLGRTAVALFNKAYYAMQNRADAVVDVDPYFYPLDALLDWNRIYGRGGFVQYQCVLPLESSAEGLTRLLREIAAVGQASFLAVLKRLGPQSFGMLSFPMPGYTLALDFPPTPQNLALLDRLDAVTMDHGGRVYLAKDARAGAATIAAGYPQLEAFRAVRRRYGLDGRFSSQLSRRLEL